MRGVLRWLAVLALLAVVVLFAAFTIHRALTPVALVLSSSTTTLPADGFSTVGVEVRASNGSDVSKLQATVDDPHRASVDSIAVRKDAAVVTLRAGVMQGEAVVRFWEPGAEPREVKLTVSPAASDSVGDGTPDFLRLHDAADRAAFRRWFTMLAEAQYLQPTNEREVDDCAALLRYSYREALRQHDAAWARANVLPAAPRASDVRQYQYPYTPLGASLFRVRDGSFAAGDLNDGAFAQFADAKTLWRYNSYFVGREIARARPGDLLFFRQEGHDLPFHAMIYLGLSQFDSDGAHQSLVIYHTGPVGSWAGEIRKPTVERLLNFPDPRWRPVPSNPSFLGVYRWNILRGTD